MPEAVRVGDMTAHSMPMQGSGSSDVFIGGQKAWRAMPAGAGDGLDEASTDTKAIMDVKTTPATAFAPPAVIPKAAKIEATMTKVAAQVEKASGICGPSGGVTGAFATLKATTLTLTAAYTSAAAVPGGEPGARVAFTMGYQQALSTAMGAAVSAMAGPWDTHTCPQATPAAHGPGLVIKACNTVFINGLPAVFKGQQVIEAAGGPVAIQMGCATVIIGDKAPSGSASSDSKGSPKAGKSGDKPVEQRSRSASTDGDAQTTSSDDPTSGEEEVLVHDEQICLVNEETGDPLVDCAYVILDGSRVVLRGRTDEAGLTERIETDGEVELTIKWGEDAEEEG